MPSALPDGDPAPSDGALPQASLQALGRRPFGIYLHVPFCSVRCGYCDFNTYTLTELGVDGASAAHLRRRRACASWTSRPTCSATAPHRSTRCSSAGALPRCCRPADLVRMLAGIRDRFGLAAGRRGDHRGQPRLGDARGARGARRGGLHPGVARHAVGGAARAADPRAHPRPGATSQRAVAGARAAGLAGQPRPHLRHAGGVARRLADQPRRRGSPRARPRLGLRAGRRGGHQAGRPGAARARCRRPRTTTRPTSTSSPTSASPAAGYRWYEVSNWARPRRRPVPPQRGLLGAAATGGGRARARTATSAACGGGTSSTPTRMPRGVADGLSPAARARDADRRAAVRRAGAARGPAASTGCPVEDLRDDGRLAVAGLIADGLVRRGRRPCAVSGWC